MHQRAIEPTCAGRYDRAMARLHFTKHLAQFGALADGAYAGETLGEALAGAFAAHPPLKSYLLDDQGGVRKHIAIFIDGAMIPRASALDHSVAADTEIYVLQALSGG
ncbi:MAG: MoaD/ThiS family protein [Hyphomonadaceae bacterium]